MDSNYVQQMFELGGTLVIFGVPPGTEFGIDLKAWNVGDEFKGVKMIPPGPHFIYISSVNKYGHTAPRTGFFHHFEEKELVVKNFSIEDEELHEEKDLEKVERIRVNLKNMDRHLGPYPFNSWSKWVSFSQHIDKLNLKRLDPLSGVICSAPDLVNKADLSEPPPSRPPDAKVPPPSIPEMVPRPGTEIRFSTFPLKPHKEGATPAEVSRGNIDSSFTLDFILGQLDRPESILSELQFSFVCFLVGQVWEGWEHWRALVGVLCKAEGALLKHHALYAHFLSILHYQIQEVPEDLFADIVESNNFMVVALKTIFANIFDNASSLPVSLVSKAKKFRNHLSSKFKWNLMLEEEEEDLPVLVQT